MKNIRFHWSFIILPATVLLFTVIFTTAFFSQLPERVTYRFSSGQPESLVERGNLLVWVLALEIVLAILSFAVTAIVVFTGQRVGLEETRVTRRLFAVIGNVLVLPQIIIAYAAVDIYLNSIYGIRLMPVATFAVGVLVLGALALATVFIPAFTNTRRNRAKTQGVK